MAYRNRPTSGRFGYTGQMYLGEVGLNYYKARVYSPTLGRFLQTDPIGQAGAVNIYAYVRNDPVNFIDPFGMDEAIVVTGQRCPLGPNCRQGIEQQPSTAANGPLGIRPPSISPPKPKPKPKPKAIPNRKPEYCAGGWYEAAQKVQQFGEGLSNFAGGVIGAGLLGKAPPIVEAGETVGAAGLAIQSVGALGKFAVSGNTAVARLDAIGLVSSFLKTQTKAAQLASGYAMGAAVSGAEKAGQMDPCE